MKINVSEAAMKGLKAGDVVEFAVGKLKVNRVENGIGNFPICLYFEGYDGVYAYTYDGKYGRYPHPLDIIAIEKAVEIPEGFTPWAGGECPVEPNQKVEVIFRGGDKDKGTGKIWYWKHDDERGDIIAYRIIPPKLEGEIWYVLHSPNEDYIDPDYVLFLKKQNAVEYAKIISKTRKILAIFQPYQTGGKWVEGDGLELLEGEGNGNN